jgi:hypothetical protein
MCLKGGTASPVTASTYLVDSRHNIQGWVEPTAKPTMSKPWFTPTKTSKLPFYGSG